MNMSKNFYLWVLILPAAFQEYRGLLCIALSVAESPPLVAAVFLQSPTHKVIAHHGDIDFTSLLIWHVKPFGQTSGLCFVLKITFIVSCLCFIEWHLVIFSFSLLLLPPTTDIYNWNVLHLIYDSSGFRIQAYCCNLV